MFVANKAKENIFVLLRWWIRDLGNGKKNGIFGWIWIVHPILSFFFHFVVITKHKQTQFMQTHLMNGILFTSKAIGQEIDKLTNYIHVFLLCSVSAPKSELSLSLSGKRKLFSKFSFDNHNKRIRLEFRIGRTLWLVDLLFAVFFDINTPHGTKQLKWFFFIVNW